MKHSKTIFESLKAAVRRPAFLLSVALLLVVLAGTAPATAEQVSLNASERRFIWDEAGSIVMSARKPDDFTKAYNAYRKLNEAGVKNGDLYYNMGVCLLKAGESDGAALMFERAERYLGNRRDVRNNMNMALSAVNKNKGSQNLSWTRFLIFWHYNLPGSVRLTLAVFGFSGIWLALAARALGIKWLSNNLMIVSVVIFVLFGSSAITTIHLESRSERILINKPDADLITGIQADGSK